jgi:allophanate hydrolase
MSALGRVDAALRAVDDVDRPEVWVHRRSRDDVERDAAAAWGEDAGPLAGLLLAVKNNVDVAGLPTTAGCPAFATEPAGADAQAVARLRAAGAVVLGTTNLDQFATGLVGQRSPHGGVRDARRPERISGGSSSGSAVAVALGLVDVAIGTDTAGSGRVPAALQGIVGIKPTLGVVSTDGVVPACRSWDAVTVFARDLGTADLAMGVMAGGPGTRTWPDDAPLAAPPRARVAVPDELPGLAPGYEEAFEAAVERLRAAGHEVASSPALGPSRAAPWSATSPSSPACARSARRRWRGATRCWCRPHRATPRRRRWPPTRWVSTPGWARTRTSATCSTCAPPPSPAARSRVPRRARSG